jgi:hypothetical protein
MRLEPAKRNIDSSGCDAAASLGLELMHDPDRVRFAAKAYRRKQDVMLGFAER